MNRDLAIVGNRPGAVNFIACDPAQARALVAHALLSTEKTDTSGGLQDAADSCGGGTAYVAYQDGVPLVLLVLNKVDWAHGRELEIRAAVALSSRRDATEIVLPEIERAFAWDCDAVTLYTRRPGLVRKLQRAGYDEAARIMRKKTK